VLGEEDALLPLGGRLLLAFGHADGRTGGVRDVLMEDCEVEGVCQTYAPLTYRNKSCVQGCATWRSKDWMSFGYSTSVSTVPRASFGTSTPRVLLGTDQAIFPVWFDYLRFPISTTTTAGDHYINLEGIRLIYDLPVTALDELVVPSARKIIENGQLFILKEGRKYNALGQLVR